jgi:hypothetical protein
MTGENPIEQGLLAQIDARRHADPLIGAKIGAKEITARLMAVFKNEKGVHIESLLCSLGALAGYSCQATVRAQAKARSRDETSYLTIVRTEDGKRYFFGDQINLLLIESKYSVWSIAAAGAQQAGGTDLPNVAEIVQHTATVLGSDAFGRLRVPENHAGGDLPVNYARALWPKLQPLIAKFCPDPMQWPVLLALSAQEAIVAGKSALDPNLALRIVMEAAIPVSKVDLEWGSEPERPVQPTPQPSKRIATPEAAAGRRSNMWIVYALAIAIIGGWQLARIARSLRTFHKPAPLTSVSPAHPGIEHLLRERKLRVATKSDYDRWLRFAAHNRTDDRRYALGDLFLAQSRMYVVQAPFTFPAGLYGANSAAFIVMPGVPVPEGNPGESIVMSMNR